MKKKALIICTGNACRSQMAEALWHELGGAEWETRAACCGPSAFAHPLASAVMRELGITLGRRRARRIKQLEGEQFDVCVMVGDDAGDTWPNPPGMRLTLRWLVPDPERVAGQSEVRLDAFRLVRDQIAERIMTLLREPREERVPVRGASSPGKRR